MNTYRADRSAQKIRSVAARQNARLFGYYVSAYGREPGNQIGWSRMTRALTRGVNIFILFYPCNSSVANLASIAKFHFWPRQGFSRRKSGFYYTLRPFPIGNGCLDNSRSRRLARILSQRSQIQSVINAVNKIATCTVKRTKFADKIYGGC